MKRVCSFFVGLVLIVLIASCAQDPTVGDAQSEKYGGWRWSTIQSPFTGRCYELITRDMGREGFAAMAEIPCEELNSIGD